MSLSRRTTLLQAAAAAAALTPLGRTALAQQAARASRAPKLAATLRIVVPANPGGGWDQTGRALGAALVAAGAAD